MVEHLLGDGLSSEEPDALDFEGGLLAQDGEQGEAVVAEFVIHALQEAVHQVGRLVEEDTLAVVFFVVREPQRVALGVVGLEERLHAFCGLLVSQVHEEGLELRKDEFGGWQEVQGVLARWLLFNLLLVIATSSGGLLSLLGRGNWLRCLFLLLLNKGGLDYLLAEFDVAKSRNDLGDFQEGLNPGVDVGDSLPEAIIESSLEQLD